MLDAAERLVAAKGFDSVSIRDVTGAAKANVAAVNYHFGSREDLLALVMMHVLEPLCAERIALLEAVGKQVSVEEAVAAFVKAPASAAARIGMETPLFYRLAGRIQCLPDESMPAALAEARRDVSARYLAVLSGSNSKVKAADWAFFEAGLAQSLIAEAGSEKPAALFEDWVAFGTRALAATTGVKKKKDDAQGFLFDL